MGSTTEISILSNTSSSSSSENNLDDSLSCSNQSEKIYLDFNATTPLDQEVVTSIRQSLVVNWSNPSSQYPAGKEAKRAINHARSSIANMIGAKSANDIVFVSGGTEANNIVFYSMLKFYKQLMNERQQSDLDKLPHIIVSEIEHDSVKLIAENYEKDGLAEVSTARVNPHGLVEVNEIVNLLRPNTILISLMLANNETGVIQPVVELTRRIAEMNIDEEFTNKRRACPLFVHTDAAQAIGKMRVNVDELRVDYLTVVGHKFYGPRIGALFARNCHGQDKPSRVSPVNHMFYGAGQENGLRPGTENTPMIVGLGKAAELVSANLDKYVANMRAARDYLEQSLVSVFGENNLHFNGRSKNCERLPNTCNVSFLGSEDFKGYIILSNTSYLEASTGACCHSGNLRASKILLAMGIEKEVAVNAVRLSVGRETTKEQIDIAIQDLKQTLKGISTI